MQEFSWSDLGLEGRDGSESTLWIGTKGANTPCHQVEITSDMDRDQGWS